MLSQCKLRARLLQDKSVRPGAEPALERQTLPLRVTIALRRAEAGRAFAAGKPPSKNEFAAVVAACEDKAKTTHKSDAMEGCLADYGLQRVQ